jgi:hypothetical protein
MAMTKSRKQARKLHIKRTRRHKRRGGQVTPLSDISTNSSMHDLDLDLDDYNEPSNNTTSESMLSDATTTTLASATNLLGQFNAAHDESLNLSNNTTAASDASSENSFSDVASSFGDLGHGGKKKMKGGKKTTRTRRHKTSKKSRRQRRR